MYLVTVKIPIDVNLGINFQVIINAPQLILPREYRINNHTLIMQVCSKTVNYIGFCNMTQNE